MYLDNFQNSFYTTNFSFSELSGEVTDTEIISDFKNAAEKNEVDIFFLNGKAESSTQKVIDIYGTDGVFQVLESKGISNKEYNSIVLGTASVKFNRLDDIKGIREYDDIYIVGDKSKTKNMNSFKIDLMDKYGGNLPKLYGSDMETYMSLFTVWGIAFLLMILITVYEIIYNKKEIALRVTLGDDIKRMFLKSVLLDVLIIIVLFITVPILIHNLTNVWFKIEHLIIFLVGFLTIDVLINLSILRINLKRDISGLKSGRGLLAINYGIKIMATIMTIIVLSSNIVVIKNAYDLKMQREFYEAHRNYSFYTLNYKINNKIGKTDEDTSLVNQKFYNKFSDKSLQYNNLTANFESTYPVLLVNQKSLKEIGKHNKDFYNIAQNIKDDDIYIFSPNNIAFESEEYSVAVDISEAFFYKFNVNNAITYSTEIRTIGIHEEDGYSTIQMKNPIIIYNNKKAQDLDLAENTMYFAYDTMYDISEAEFFEFINENQLTNQIVTKSNVLDVYEHHWTLALRALKITLFLTVILLALEAILIFFITRLEYSVNSIEMALKKIHGYNIYNRSRKQIMLTITSAAVSIVISCIFNYYLELRVMSALIIVGLLFTIIEVIYIFRRSIIIEKENIGTVLKGERV